MSLGVRLLNNKAKKIKLLAMDVDGVLTRGDILVLKSGEEVKMWNSKDRLILSLMRNHKIPLVLAWITGRKSQAVSASAKDLGVKYVIQNCVDKKSALLKIVKKLKIQSDEVAFIGDDLIDLPALQYAGFSACPFDAVPDVKSRVHFISRLSGGEAVVRDVIEFILKAKNLWQPLIKPYLS